MLYPAHLTSTQTVSVGSGRLELYRSVLRYCSKLEWKEQLMLNPSLCCEGDSCYSLVWFPLPFSLLVSCFPEGASRKKTDPAGLWSWQVGVLCTLWTEESCHVGLKTSLFPWHCALRNLLASAFNTAVTKWSLSGMYFQHEGLQNPFSVSYFGEEEDDQDSSIFSCLWVV